MTAKEFSGIAVPLGPALWRRACRIVLKFRVVHGAHADSGHTCNAIGVNCAPSAGQFEIQQVGVDQIPMDNARAKPKNTRTESILFSSSAYPFYEVNDALQ